MSDIVWQDPPTAARVWYRWLDEAAELRAHPKRWALLTTTARPEAARNFATQGRRGRRVAFRPVGEWEFRTTGCDVYARYIGEETT